MHKAPLGTAFNRLWAASLASNLADGLLYAAVPLLAVTLTRDPLLISLVGALSGLPWLLLAVVIGGLADRLDRRRLLASANSIRFATTFVVAILIYRGQLSIGLLLVVAFVWGTCEVLVDTTAQTLIPQVLGEQQLERGNARLQVAETVVQGFIGTPLSSVLFAVIATFPFFLSTFGYAAAGLLVLLIPAAATVRKPRTDGTEHHTFWQDLRVGISYLAGHKQMRRLVLMTASMSFWSSAAYSTVVLFMLDEMHVQPAAFGLLMAVSGLGSLAGGLAAPRLSQRFGRGQTMVFCGVVMTGAMLLQGLAPNIVWFVAAGMLANLTVSVWNVLLMSSYQVLIPAQLYGRVHGARRTLVWGVGPLGAVTGGLIAHVGLRWPLIIGGAIAVAIAALNSRFVRELVDSTVVPAATAD